MGLGTVLALFLSMTTDALNHDPFSSFDPTRYQRVSNMALQTIVSLAKALDATKPEDLPAHVEKLADRMRDTATAAEEAMITRLREQNQASRLVGFELDNAIDPLWSLLSRRLDDWSTYLRPGLDFLEDDPDSPPEVDIEQLRDKATRANRLSAHLFGQTGLAFAQRPYPEQAQLMANILGLIDADELEDELIELTGPELLPMMRRCQTQYEAMVQARASRKSGSAADLRSLRGQLRKVITRYAGAVITMLDEEEPESLAIVEVSLEPMLNLRAPTRSTGGVEEAEDIEEIEEIAEVDTPDEAEEVEELEQVG